MPEPNAWPRLFTSAPELLAWLDTQRPLDAVGKKRVLTLRWLVHAELERTVPDPPRAITHFTPDAGPPAPLNPPEDLTSTH